MASQATLKTFSGTNIISNRNLVEDDHRGCKTGLKYDNALWRVCRARTVESCAILAYVTLWERASTWDIVNAIGSSLSHTRLRVTGTLWKMMHTFFQQFFCHNLMEASIFNISILTWTTSILGCKSPARVLKPIIVVPRVSAGCLFKYIYIVCWPVQDEVVTYW